MPLITKHVSVNQHRSAGFATIFAAVLAACMAAPLSSASAGTSPVGVWLDHTKRGAVEIYSCGSHLCGRIVWMKRPLKPSGEPRVDVRNEKKALRKRAICGIKMLGRLRNAGARSWEGGWIYSPERGKTFDALVKVRDENTLSVTGYRFSPAFGKTFTWTRAPEDIGRCAPAVEAASNVGN